MRIIFFLLITCLLQQTLLSQQPSKEEMQAQMAQVKKEINQQVADLEKQIADAKLREENPETIKELENRLASIKKMLAVMNKAGTMNNERPRTIASTNELPKYISPIVPIILKQPVIVPTEKEAKDQLLWYNGKKIDPITLVTTKGMVVRYDKTNNRVIVKPDEKKDTAFINLVKTLSKTEIRKNNFATKIGGIKNSFLMYPEIMKSYEEFDLIRERYDKIARNTIDLPATVIAKANFLNINDAITSGPFSDFEIITTEILISLEEVYEQLLALLNNPSPLDFPVPPKRPGDLCLCDPKLRLHYETAISKWNDQFSEYENKLLENAMAIKRHLTDTKDTSAARMPNLNADVDKAFKLAFERKDKKIEMLMSRYLADVHREEVVVQAIMDAERQKEKSGIADLNSSNIAKARAILLRSDFDHYIDQEMMARNYSVIFDYSLYLSHEFHKQLLGINVDVNNTGFFKWRSKLEDFNRFKLSIDLDFEYQVKDEGELMMQATGVLKSNTVYVSLGRLGCKWQLFLTNTNYETGDENDFRIPVRVLNGEKRYKVKNVWEIYPYIGPKDMLMVFPSIRMKLCEDHSKDSALMDVLRYTDEIYNTPNLNIAGTNFNPPRANLSTGREYTVDMLGYANKIFVSIENTQQNADEFIGLIGEMMDVGSTTKVQNPTGNSILDQLQIEYSGNLQQHEKQKKLTDISKVDHTVILFEAGNSSPVLINETINTAHTDKKVIDLLRGLITLKVVHFPVRLTPQSQQNN